MTQSAESYLESLDAGALVGQTVAELLGAYRQMAQRPSHADPSWQRLVFEGFTRAGGATLLFYRDIEIEEHGTTEEPYPIGISVAVDDRSTSARLVDGQVDGFAYVDEDAPPLTTAAFFDALGEHLRAEELLDLRATHVEVVL